MIPLLIAFVVTTVESVGDITASCDVSRVETSGPVFESRIQGGILADGVNSLIAVLMTGNPTTTFSQNNGTFGGAGGGSAWVLSGSCEWPAAA